SHEERRTGLRNGKERCSAMRSASMGVVSLKSKQAAVKFAELNTTVSEQLPDEHAALLQQSNFAVIISYPWKYEEHIDTLEMRAALTSVTWALSSPSAHNSRITLLTDSAVVHGAIRKGRSSSFPLLRVQRVLSACLLACGSQL